jgi:hypothetical protein
MTKSIGRDTIYRCRRFSAETIELCVRWYITYRLSANAPDLTKDETRQFGRVPEIRISSSSLPEEVFVWW